MKGLYLLANYPDSGVFAEHILSAEKIDFIEIAVPFTEALLDPPAIQMLMREQIQKKMTGDLLFANLKKIFEKNRKNTRIYLRSYSNIVYNKLRKSFEQKCKENGVHGIIIPDIEYQERAGFRNKCNKKGLTCPEIVTPQTSPERLKDIAEATDDFILYQFHTTQRIPQKPIVRQLEILRKNCMQPIILSAFRPNWANDDAYIKLFDGKIDLPDNYLANFEVSFSD